MTDFNPPQSTPPGTKPESSSDLPPNSPVTRRQMIAGLAALTASGLAWGDDLQSGSVLGNPLPTQAGSTDALGATLPTRAMGRTNEQISILGLGGQHFRFLPEDQRQACIETAIEGGIRFFDTATNYGRDQESERAFGQHLTPRYRDHIFLMTKSAAREADRAQRELDQSLANMKTDVLDLWQIHTIESVEDVDRRFDNGVIDVFLRAKEAGKVRYIGFTGHKAYQAHLRMLERFEELGIDMDTVQMPVNVVDPQYESYITEVLPILMARGYGVLAMKTMCGGKLFGQPGDSDAFGPRGDAGVMGLIPEKLSFAQASSYVLSLPVATRITGFDTVEQVQENIDVTRAHQPLSPEDQAAILAVADNAGGPRMEFYKRNVLPNANENF